MKTSQDPRHIKRQHVVQELFKIQFHIQPVSERAQEIVSNLESIDERIHRAAPEFPVDKINRIDLSILRLAVFELVIEKKSP